MMIQNEPLAQIELNLQNKFNSTLSQTDTHQYVIQVLIQLK